MTLEEFKRTGKDGIYRADLDEWFLVGEEPEIVSAIKKAEPEEAPKKASEPQSAIAEQKDKGSQSAELKTPIAGKKHA